MSGSGGQKGKAFMPAILRRLAPRLGAEVTFEPEYEIVGRIRFPNGRQSYFWHNKFNLNSVASARIAQDKGHCNFFLEECGFRVPRSLVVFEEAFRLRMQFANGFERALSFGSEVGWQAYLKPLRGSQGDGVIRVRDAAEFEAALRQLFEKERRVLVQQACSGRDYRFVTLDGEVISAYERIPLSVCGDGSSAITELLAAKQLAFDAAGRDTVIPVHDPRISQTLRRNGLSLASVLPAGTEMRLLDVANLSCGGTSAVVTEQIHPSVAALAVNIAQAMDLRFAGVDILIDDAAAPLGDYTVLEVNSAPGLDHYGASGPEQEAHVDGLYLKLLEAIARGPTSPAA